MIRNSFKEEEIPYEVLETFGLTREMVEDLPLCVLQQISNGRRSPVLPIHVKDNQGNIIKSRTRFSLIRNEDGKVDVFSTLSSNRATCPNSVRTNETNCFPAKR